MSNIGVPSFMSMPLTISIFPDLSSSSIFSSFTHESPIGFGLNGDLVAKTPRRMFPPSLGGRTVGQTFLFSLSENPQRSHRCENPSIPRIKSGSRNSFSNIILPRNSGTRPLCLGMPNFSGKSVPICAIGLNSISKYPFLLS